MWAPLGVLVLLTLWGLRFFLRSRTGKDRPALAEHLIQSSSLAAGLLHALISDRGYLRADTSIGDVNGSDVAVDRKGACGRLVLHPVSGFSPENDLADIAALSARHAQHRSATVVVIGGDDSFGRRVLDAARHGRTIHITARGAVTEKGRGFGSSAPRLVVDNALDRMAADLGEGGLPAIDVATARTLVSPALLETPVSPPFRGVATAALTAAVMVCFAVETLISVDSLRGEGAALSVVYRMGAIHRASVLAGEWQRLIAAPFLHFGLLHLVMNSWAQWSLGGPIEFLVGSRRFLVLWLVSALGASVTSLLFNETSVSAGASGAIFGLLGAFTTFVFFRKDILPQPVPKALRNGILTTLLLNLMISFVPSIDMAAHAGGFLTGAVMAFGLSRRDRKPGPSSALAVRLVVAAVVLAGVGLTSFLDRAGAATRPPALGSEHRVSDVRLPIPEGFSVSESKQEGLTIVEADGSPASPYSVTFRVSESQADDESARHVLEGLRDSRGPGESTDWIALSRAGITGRRAVEVVVVAPASCRSAAEALSAELAENIR